MSLEVQDLPAPQAAALLESPCPLADIYKDFRDMETGHMDNIRECIEGRAESLMEAQRETAPIIPIYPHTGEYAREHGELDAFLASLETNVACRDAIETAIREGFDGMSLHADTKGVLAAFGAERVSHVLAATLQGIRNDPRVSSGNQAWAATVPMFDTASRPILANIYLNELDKYMEEYKQKFSQPTRTVNPAHRNMASRIFHYKAKNDKVWNTLSAEEQKKRARILRQMRAEQRNLPTHPLRETSYKSLQYVRYADDFLIGVVGSREDAERLKQDLAVFLKEKLGLTLSAEKTKITNTAQCARFLNYDIYVSRSQDIKRLKNGKRQRVYYGVVQLRMPHEKWAAKLLELGAIRISKDKSGKERWKAMPRGKLMNRTDTEILSRYNSEVRGYYNYYSLAGNVSTLNHFSSLMKYSMLKTFGSKYRCQVRKIKERYVKDGEFTVPYTTKAGPKEAIYYHDGFRKQDKPQLGQVDILDIYKKYSKPNSLATRLRSKQCELCGAQCGGLVMHQVRRLKDLTGQYEWEILMRKRHRKTLAVCPSCYAEIHNSMKS